MQDGKSHQAHAKARSPRRRIFTGAVAVAGSTGLAAAVLLPSGTALAAYQQGPASDTASSTIATVTVATAIGVSAVTPQAGWTAPFVPGDTPPALTSAVTMVVFTNDTAGYNVTVVALSNLTNQNDGDTIPAADLSVQNTAGTNSQNTTDLGYMPISTTTAIPVYGQAMPSADDGNTISENWEFNQPIPSDVTDGTYSLTLNFVASGNVT